MGTSHKNQVSMQTVKSLRVLFICSPSTGTLDCWLPVIDKLKHRYPDSVFTILFPRNHVISDLDTDSTLIKISDTIFSEIVFRGPQRSVWYQCDTFKKAKESNADLLNKLRIRNRLQRFIPDRFRKYLFKNENFLTKDAHIVENMQRFLSQFNAVFYDVNLHNKKYQRRILGMMKDTPKFSISHGLNPISTIPSKPDPLSKHLVDQNITVFVNSDMEVTPYQARTALSSENILITGVARHHPDWIDYFTQTESESEKSRNLFKDDFIFVISRPDRSDFHPTERMKKSIETIKHTAFDVLNVKIVIKLHPKESKRTLYEEILGKEEYGKKWMFSNAHFFTIGKKCLFAVSYFSGVAVDLIALTVPTIELLNLKGIENYENGRMKDAHGVPVLNYRYHGLVLGASNRQEFLNQVKKVMMHRESAINELKEGYRKLYFDPTDSLDITVDTILQKTFHTKNHSHKN